MTIDLPESDVSFFETQARAENGTLIEILADRLRKASGETLTIEQRRSRYPLIRSSQPSSMNTEAPKRFDLFDLE